LTYSPEKAGQTAQPGMNGLGYYRSEEEPNSLYCCKILSMEANGEFAFFNSREPRVILQSESPNCLAICRWGIFLRSAFTSAHRFAISAISAGVHSEYKKRFDAFFVLFQRERQRQFVYFIF
jgi:hypothetical protein